VTHSLTGAGCDLDELDEAIGSLERLRARAAELGEKAAGDLDRALRTIRDYVAATSGEKDELERRVAERTAELESERARLAAIVEELPAGVLIMDADTGEYVLANRRVGELWRREFAGPGEIAAFRQGRGYHPDGRLLGAREWPLQRVLDTGEAIQSQLVRFRRADETFGVLDIRAAPIRAPGGQISSAVAVFQDITERHRREQAESEFIANAAHELQTPLAAITSAVEVLQAGAKEIPDHRDRFLGHIQREAGRLGRLARALLVLARAQTGGEEPRREVLALQPMLQRVAATLRTAPRVAVEVRCPLELAVVTNHELVAQALDNVGRNAAKFTSEGSIVFTAEAAGDGTVVIEVTDTGPGIPENEQQRVFDRFYRTEGTEEVGFGLGLAIVREAMSALGGRVEVRSASGGGTVVRLDLPGARLT